MIIELQPHHIAEIRTRSEKPAVNRTEAAQATKDIKALLGHIEWQEGEIKRIDDEWRAYHAHTMV